jgi:hypothetical protein
MDDTRGQIGGQDGGSKMSQSGGGGSSQDYGQPRWNVPKSDLRDQIDSLDNFVIVGTKQGQPFVASTNSQQQAQQLFRQHAGDLTPQTA